MLAVADDYPTGGGGPGGVASTTSSIRASQPRVSASLLKCRRVSERTSSHSQSRSASTPHLHRFQTLEEVREVIAEFIARYNREWLIERLEYQTPSPARAASWRAAA